MGTTTPGGLPYPEPTDPVAAGADNIKALAEATDDKIVNVFATVAARDAWTGAPIGAVCVTADTDTMWQRVAGPKWIPVGGGGAWTFGAQFVTGVVGTANAAYRKTGTTVTWSGMFVGTPSQNPIANAPFPFRLRGIYWVGSVLYRSVGAQFKTGTCYNTDDGTGLTFAHNEAANGGILGPTAPFTWKAGDQCSWSITYETAP